jgi:uncharacterized protein
MGISGFDLDLPTLRTGASGLQLEAEAHDIGLPDTEWSGVVSGDCTVERNGDRINVRGQLRAVAWLECVRCLKGFEYPLRVPFEVFAERAGTSRHRDEEAELERDDYMRFHDGKHLDLRGDAREALLLELPMTPRCREGCLGLCPTCGADRNEGPCTCSASTGA